MRRHAAGYLCLSLRRGKYYFCKVVPLALRSILGKREILVPLRTKRQAFPAVDQG